MILRILGATLAVCLALAAAPALAQSKIGFVNTQRVLSQSAPAVRAQKRLEAEFQKRGVELERMADQLKRMQDDLDRNLMTMAEAQRRNREREFGELNRDFQRKQRELREDMNQRKNEELRLVIDQAERVIRQIAEQEKFDIIFQDAAYVAPRVDITDKVIKALEDKPPAK
jgi:outer membrane protein